MRGAEISGRLAGVTENHEKQRRLLNVSLAVAVLLLAAKTTAAAMTGSAAIYSDAAESVVHLFAVLFASWALRMAVKPADSTHHFGHDKVTYLSSGFEGAMIIMASMLILYEAGRQFVHGVEIRNLGLGIALTAAAAAVNLALGLSLLAAGKSSGSPLLRANGLHVLTDVWTSLAVLVALLLILWTGWLWWDPIIATLAGLNILHTGLGLIRQGLGGLLDEADPLKQRILEEALDRECAAFGVSYHNVRHRHSGRFDWVEFHLVFDDGLRVSDAHAVATAIEGAVAARMGPAARVISHLEPKSAEHHVEHWETR